MLKNWSLFEKGLLIIATILILGLSLYWGDSVIGIISSVTGIICVILTAKGSIKSYYFGLINVSLYCFISYQQSFYGEVMLNGLYYIPMQFIGYLAWSKHLTNTGYVQSQRLSNQQRILITVGSVVAIVAYGIFLKQLGGNLAYIDSTSTILSIVAMYLGVKRYMEQWALWIIVNVVSIIMWGVALTQGSTDIATLLMWVAYLVNAVYGYVKWNKESKVSIQLA